MLNMPMKTERVDHMEANIKTSLLFKILILSLSMLSLVSCSSNYNLNKELSAFDLTLKVDETTDFIIDYSSNDNYLFIDEDSGLYLVVQQIKYSTDVPEFKGMADKFIADMNNQEESEVLVNKDNAVVIINKQLKSSSSHDDKYYDIDGLYLNGTTYYCVFVYGDYDSMSQNKDWVKESLKTVTFTN